MRTTFFIELNMKTPTGFECIGSFDIGDNRQFAIRLFSQLAGHPTPDDASVLHLDLVEKYRGLPLGLEVISCSMEDLCANVRTITRELFKQRSLDEAKA